ncbi:MAG: HEAT repeat domain-containing protein [Planctomycetota bacterium]
MRVPTMLLLFAVAAFAAGDLDRVRELGKTPGEAASKSLAKLLGSRDAAVREAAVRALGGRPDESARKALRGALKTFAKDENLLPVVVASIGASGDLKSAKAVADLARKSVGSDVRTARVCIDTLGLLRAPESVEVLVDLLAPAIDPRGASHPELADELHESLREVTGLPFRRPATFVEWWRHAKGRWKGEGPEPPEKGDVYRHDGWRFGITRPDAERWSFKRVEGAVIRLVYSGPKDEAGFAWVDVLALSSTEGGPKTSKDEAAVRRKWMEAGLSKPRDVRWGFRTKLGRVAAVGNEATGILKAGHVVRWRTFSVVRNGLAITVSAHVETGASEKVFAEVDRILASFTALDR